MWDNKSYVIFSYYFRSIKERRFLFSSNPNKGKYLIIVHHDSDYLVSLIWN